MILFILGNYKYQPALSADELEAVEEINELKEVQTRFVEKNDNEFARIDLTQYKVNSGYSDLLLLIQDLLQLDVVSGYYNEETEQAIRELQEASNLEVTGQIDEASFEKIMTETLPLSEAELMERGDLIRLLQRQFNLDEDGVIGDSTRHAIEQLKLDLNQNESKPVYDTALINEDVVTYIIEQLNS